MSMQNFIFTKKIPIKAHDKTSSKMTRGRVTRANKTSGSCHILYEWACSVLMAALTWGLRTQISLPPTKSRFSKLAVPRSLSIARLALATFLCSRRLQDEILLSGRCADG